MQRSVIIAGFALTTLVAAVASAETFDLRRGPRTPALLRGPRGGL